MLATLLAALALVALPQDPPPPASEEPSVLSDVIATGRAPRAEARDYIAEVGKPIPGVTLARWHHAICVGVVNLRPDLTELIVRRVHEEAEAIGVRTRSGSCKPNVFIIATDAAQATARGLVDDDPLFFRPAGGGTDLGPTHLRRFTESEAPVRWWHVAMPVSNDTGQLAIALDAQAGEGPPTIADRSVSRLQSVIRSEMAWLMIIVDVTKTGEVPASALADYISMVTLAQINAEGDTSGRDTILNLFDDPAAPRVMSEWDRAYLQALYAVQTGRPTSGVQARDIERAMVERRQTAQDAGEE